MDCFNSAMNFSDDELEKQYAPSQWSPFAKSEEILRDFISETVRGSYIARNMVPGTFDLSYGKTDNQKVDIFGENKLSKEASIFVFIHGGYWISGSRKDSSFPVRPLFEAGILSIILGYDLVSDTFTLPELVTQIQRGIKFVLEYAQKRGSRGVYFCGHSAGSHLIVMALSSDPPEDKLYPLIKGLILFSGIYDLVPLLKTTNAKAAHITKDIADFCSPMKAISSLKNNVNPLVPIWICVAEHDSPAFQKQSEDYTEALRSSGFPSVQHCFFYNGLDHFTLVQNLYDKDFFITKKVIEFIVTEHRKLKKAESKNCKKSGKKSSSNVNAEKEENAKIINCEDSKDDDKVIDNGDDTSVSENGESGNHKKEESEEKETTKSDDNEKKSTNNENITTDEISRITITENKEQKSTPESKSSDKDSTGNKGKDSTASKEKDSTVTDDLQIDLRLNEDDSNEKEVKDDEKEITDIQANGKEIAECNGMGIDDEADEGSEIQAQKSDITETKEKVTAMKSSQNEITESGSSHKSSVTEVNHKESNCSDDKLKMASGSENSQKEAKNSDNQKGSVCNDHDVKAS